MLQRGEIAIMRVSALLISLDFFRCNSISSTDPCELASILTGKRIIQLLDGKLWSPGKVFHQVHRIHLSFVSLFDILA